MRYDFMHCVIRDIYDIRLRELHKDILISGTILPACLVLHLCGYWEGTKQVQRFSFKR